MKDNPDLHKVTTKGQITLPKKLRDRLQINPGDYVSIFQVGAEIVLTKKAPSQSHLFAETSAIYQSFLEKCSKGELTTTLNKIYDQAILLEERDRVLLIRFLLDSLDKPGKQYSDDELLSLKGIGGGLWGTKEEIEKHIEEERSSWEK